MGEAESDPTVILSAEDETASLPGHGGLPRGAAEKTRPDVLRTPKRLGELLGEDGVPTLEGPVLVSHAGNPAEELVRATVYPVASMIAGAAPRPERLEDELARFGVGRTSANDIVIDALAVSKRHAAIVRLRGCRWSVVDEGSSNGTFVDARRLEVGRPVPLGVLTTIRFGPRARFAFMHPAAFSDYASSVRAEARRRGTALLRIPLPSLDRLSCDTARRTQPRGTFEPLAARIISRLRAAPVAARYVVERDGMPPLEVDTLSEVVAVVEQAPRGIAQIRFVSEKGDRAVVYDRGEPGGGA